jgi:hypothetical protein
MKVDIQKLKGRMAEKDKTIGATAKCCGMARDTFSGKMRGGGLKFTLGEVFLICDCLDLDKEDVIAIFMADDDEDVEKYIL